MPYRGIRTHTEALSLLNGKKAYAFPGLVGTCFVPGKDQDIELQYHGSTLVTYHQDNTFTVSTCGFHTKTTKRRINMFGPVDLYQKNFELFFGPNKEPFTDGMRFDSDGIPVEPEDYLELNPDWEGDPREATLDNQIQKMYL